MHPLGSLGLWYVQDPPAAPHEMSLQNIIWAAEAKAAIVERAMRDAVNCMLKDLEGFWMKLTGILVLSRNGYK